MRRHIEDCLSGLHEPQEVAFFIKDWEQWSWNDLLGSKKNDNYFPTYVLSLRVLRKQST